MPQLVDTSPVRVGVRVPCSKVARNIRKEPPSKSLQICGERDTSGCRWDVKTHKERFPLVGHSISVNAIAFSRDGKLLATTGADRTIRFWDWKTGHELAKVGDEGHGMGLTFSPDGKRLVSLNLSGVVKMWDVTAGGSLLVRGSVLHSETVRE